MTELRKRRLAAGLTLQAAAHCLGITAVHLSDMERGNRNITPARARQLAEFYGCRVEDLVERFPVRIIFRARGASW